MKTRKLLALGVAMALTAGTVGLAGCGGPSSTTGTDTSSTAGGTKTELTGAITIAGSDTMVNLAQAWAEEFMKANPGVQLSVKGGGSGTGIAALINGTVDFADSSRDMKPEEIAQAHGQGRRCGQDRRGSRRHHDHREPVQPDHRHHQGQPRQDLPRRDHQLEGRSAAPTSRSRWCRATRPPERTRCSSSKVLGEDKKFAKSTKLLPSTQAIVDEVKANADAIGYIGIGYESADIKPITLDGKAATKATVLDGSYELARTLQHVQQRRTEGRHEGLRRLDPL